MIPQLRRLVIKPTFECTASCPTCSLRLDLYEKRKREKQLSCEQWQEVIADAHHLGCRDLHISGGEPMLYPELPQLIEIGTRLGMTINVNTNGSRVPPDFAQKLIQAGLNSLTVSIYSWRPDVNDDMRREPGLFNRAIHTVQYLRQQTNLQVDLQTILARDNVLELDHFIEIAYELGVGYIYVSYVEGDVKNQWLPTFEQIQTFRREIVPRIRQVICERAPNNLKDLALDSITKIFSDDQKRMMQFSKGLYHPEEKPPCPRPYNFILVLVNGEVHPCNGVEYNHSPVMGNVHHQRLTELWQNSIWNQFRVQRHDWCHRCPMMLHFRIPIMGESR